jgi:hypothetical protein
MNAVWDAIKLWIWRHLAHPLAWSLREMVVRRQWMFALLQRLSPNFLALALSLGELSRNTFIWWMDGGPFDLAEENQTITSLVEDISDLINRTSLPWGVDRYRIVVTRLGSLPTDSQSLDYDKASASLITRPQKGCWDLSGNRWKDWKQGDGQGNLFQVLRQAAPYNDEPVTVVQVAVLGHSLAYVMNNFQMDINK